MTAPHITIFLDLDGVLADFDGHMHARGKVKAGGKPDYDAMDLAWWTSIPVFEGARSFYHSLKKEAPVKFLTAPVPSVDCFAGKAQWIQDFVPGRGRWALLDLIICPGTAKQMLAGPGRILIDDRAANIESWQKAGGIGILHTGDFARTLAAVRQAAAGLAPRSVPPLTPKFTP